jgi:NAD(P)-dependent dehydrogenase (short-subunit alcohol dehydrogenase family)
MCSLEGKLAVITGGSSGLGLAIAQRFTKEGAFVDCGLSAERARHGRCFDRTALATVQGDVQNARDLDRLYARIREEKGKIDILVADVNDIDTQALVDTREQNFETCAAFSRFKRHSLSFAMAALLFFSRPSPRLRVFQTTPVTAQPRPAFALSSAHGGRPAAALLPNHGCHPPHMPILMLTIDAYANISLTGDWRAY